jgi:hypothetical protein
VSTDLQADLPAAAANHTRNRWPIALPGAVATLFIGTAAGWVCSLRVFAAFLAGVFSEFVGFDQIIR